MKKQLSDQIIRCGEMKESVDNRDEEIKRLQQLVERGPDSTTSYAIGVNEPTRELLHS